VAKVVVNVGDLNGLLSFILEKIRNFNEREKLKLQSYWVSMDEDLSISFLVIQLIVILKVVCTF